MNIVGGRLPITWYPADYINKLPMTSMTMRPIKYLGYPGRTYKFYDGPTVYPFGYGLSYSKFSYKLSEDTTKKLNIKLDARQQCHHLQYVSDNANNSKSDCQAVLVEDLTCNDNFTFKVEVKNESDRDGNEVVLVYAKPPQGIDGTHSKQVIGFQRVFVKGKKSKEVNFSFNPCKSLSIVEYNAYRVVPSGVHTILVGDNKISSELNVTFSKP